MPQISIIIPAYNAERTIVETIQSVQQQTIHNFELIDLYLQHHSDIREVIQAQQHLWSAIRLQPKTLLDKTTQRLVIKSLVKRTFPPKLVSYLSQFKSKYQVSSDPRFQS